MLIALALDLEGRARAPGLGSEKAMRRAYDEFGRTGETYDQDDIMRLAGLVVGGDMDDFFRRYVEGVEAPIEDYLTRSGLS